jgi:GT2 family glycosyltransferase
MPPVSDSLAQVLPAHSVRLLQKKFPGAKLVRVSGVQTELSDGEIAVWVFSEADHNKPAITHLNGGPETVVLIPAPGCDTASGWLRLLERLRTAGYQPDYDCDLLDVDPGALLVRRDSPTRSDILAVECAMARLQERVRRVERTLRTRMSELQAAHRHIGQLEEKALELRDAKQELSWLRAQNHDFRTCVRRKLGGLVLAPYLVPRKVVRTLVHQVRESRARRSRLHADQRLHYHEWFLRHRATHDELLRMREEAKAFSFAPLISIITPVFDTPVELLEAAVNSVLGQVYDNWELLLVDDASSDPATIAALSRLAESDPRIRQQRREVNGGISAASNDALRIAQGEWVAFLDHDDVLEPDALFHVAKLLQTDPAADLIYTDEDKLAGEVFEEPFLKPDWAPDLFLSYNYLCHFVVVRRSLIDEVGGLRADFDGAQDYDLELRVIEKTHRIHHIPRVLYHWRRTANSTAEHIFRKPLALEAGRKAIQAHMDRCGEAAYVTLDWRTQAYWVKREIRETRRIAIIIPMRDQIHLLARCLETLAEKTTYPNYEIVIVDNDSQSEEARDYLARTPHRVLHFGGPFNYSCLNNFAVEQTDAPWLLFLNNDTEILEGDWLSAMAEHVQRAEVGAVGARLLLPDGTVQHAGVVLGVSGTGNHAYFGFGGEDPGVHRQLQVIRNYSAVTGACLLTRRDVFKQVNGFDEEALPVNFNDVDLCLKIRRAGYLIVYTPFAKLIHHGSATRSASVHPWEDALMRERYQEVLAHDPYYNPNLSRVVVDFSLGDARGYERVGR